MRNKKFIPLNFDKIREKDEYQNLFKDCEKRRFNYIKYLKLAIYTFCICFISVISTLVIANKDKIYAFSDNNGEKLSDAKDDEFIKDGLIDTIFAFGNEYINEYYSYEFISRTNLINDLDKKELEEYVNFRKNNNQIPIFRICLGFKGDIEYVIFKDCGNYEDGKTFRFLSNLDYSYRLIIDNFSKSTNHQITDEMLNESRYVDGRQVKGIVLYFVKTLDGNYHEGYFYIFQGKKRYTTIDIEVE